MRVAVEPLERLVAKTFLRAGCPEDEASRIAHYLVKANLTGHDSHGVIRVQRYLAWLREGRVYPGRHAEIVLETPVLAVVEGHHGFGQTIGPEACALGCRKAKDQGLALIALRRSGHLGRIGDFAELAIEEGLVSLHFVNAYNSLLVAPFGARERRFSTNPICIGVPTGDDRPFVLDFATSLVAEGKCLVAHQGGQPIPPDALVGPDGRLTGDTQVLYGPAQEGAYPDPRKGPGAMRAFGEHKGSGLALACELLAGALTGSGINADPDGPFHNGMLSLYIAPEALAQERGSFLSEVRRFLAWIRSAAPIDPKAGVLVPGDKERMTAAERRAHGIPLSPQTWEAILDAARAVGLSSSEIDAILG